MDEKQGRIEEHFEYVDQNLCAPHQDFVEQHEYLLEDFHAVTGVSHNGSSLRQILVDFVGTHQIPEGHGED